MGDIINEDETGHPPSLSQSRYERMQEQYNNFVEEEEHWQDVRRLRHGCVSPPFKCAVLSSFLVTCDRNWLAGRIAAAAPRRN